MFGFYIVEEAYGNNVTYEGEDHLVVVHCNEACTIEFTKLQNPPTIRFTCEICKESTVYCLTNE